MRVTALVRYPVDTVGSQRYRIEQWQPELARLGIELDLHHLLDDPALMEGLWLRPPRLRSVAVLATESVRRLRQMLTCERPDAVYLHREASMMGPPLVEMATALRVPLVFDLDDAIWLSGKGLHWWSPTRLIRMPAKTRWIMRMSAGVSAGNKYIAGYASRYARTIEIVPSTIDTTRLYKRTKIHRANGVLVIGWTGSPFTATYIEDLLPTLAEVARDIPMRLLVIGAKVEHPELDIVCRPWQSQTEVDDLLMMDVGLMPLADDEWSRGKCGMKALQYMALGIPPVVSPVGVNQAIVDDGNNGFHARNPCDWGRALSMLRDPAARNHLGRAARRKVEEQYSSRVGAVKLARLFETVVAGKGSSFRPE